MPSVGRPKASRTRPFQLREGEKGEMLTAIGYKGYRMVRATRGVSSGVFFFEVRVGECLQGEDGHMRIGWCTDSGDVQAPTGYDGNS